MENLNFNFDLTIAKPGTRAVGSSSPELYTAPTINKFVLNSLASKKMNLQHKDTVTILVNEKAEDINQMYFLTKGIDGMCASLAANLNKDGEVAGDNLSFSYAGVWSRMVQYEVDAIEVSMEDLAKQGLADTRTTEAGKTAHSALRKVFFKVGDAIESGDMTVYPLIESRVDDFKPRGKAEETEPETETEVDND